MFYRLTTDKDLSGSLNSLSMNQETGRVYVSGGIDYESTKVNICLFTDNYVIYKWIKFFYDYCSNVYFFCNKSG